MYCLRFGKGGAQQRGQSFSKSLDNSLQTLLQGEAIHSFLHKSHQPQVCSYGDAVCVLTCKWMERVRVGVQARDMHSLCLVSKISSKLISRTKGCGKTCDALILQFAL